MARVEVLFFGRMADVTGVRQMTRQAERLLELRDAVFGEAVAGVKMSVNRQQVSADMALNEGDEVAFFSVFSGG